MASEKRNATVVFALVVAMTVGAQVLLCFESWLGARKPQWEGDTRLTAERGARVHDVVVSYARSLDDIAQLGVAPDDSLCTIDAAGEVRWDERPGPRVQVVLAGSPESSVSEKLDPRQQRSLLAVLGALSQAGGVEIVPLTLAAGSDSRVDPTLPPAVKDLADLLVRKQFID